MPNKGKIHRNTQEHVIWDVFPSEFTSAGFFERFIQRFKRCDFSVLIEEEKLRVLPFLQRWGALLNTVSTTSARDLVEYFSETPKLSGVLYFSHSTVLSEAFFLPYSDQISHPTDRIISEEAASLLPSAKDLTFSFPRKYKFAGFYNSWGFVRVERSDQQGNHAGLLFSVTTLDSEILNLLRQHGFQQLVHLYNQSWNGAIHDYIHHLALYTNPSFGIGKRSPMSLCNVHREIDQWGQDMVDTFNYEYWAHKTHRLITERLPELDPQQMVKDAKDYFLELVRLQEHLYLMGYDLEYVQRIGEYLGSIYLWPLHILIHPYGSAMEVIGGFIEQLDLPVKEDKVLEAAKLLSGDHLPQDCACHAKLLLKFMQELQWDKTHPRLQENIQAFKAYRYNEAMSYVQFLEDIAIKKLQHSIDFTSILFSKDCPAQDRELQLQFLSLLSAMNDTPLLTGISLSLKALNIKSTKEAFTKSEWLRFKVAITVQRGMYNCWNHEHPVIFCERPSHPLTVFAIFFEILRETLSNYQPYLLNRNSYELSGICP